MRRSLPPTSKKKNRGAVLKGSTAPGKFSITAGTIKPVSAEDGAFKGNKLIALPVECPTCGSSIVEQVIGDIDSGYSTYFCSKCRTNYSEKELDFTKIPKGVLNGEEKK